MSKEMVVATSSHETKVALVEEGRVVEVYVEREKEFGLVGSIYKGRVTRVLPGMQSAFVDIGLDRDAFLYVSDFFEDLEEYEREATPEVEEPPADTEVPAPAEPAAAPEGEPAADAQPPGEERQPVFERAEPPLSLPERRPQGRGRPRHRRPHRRGGRGRHRHGRGPVPRPASRREALPSEPHEPVVLPGESLAKYRNRTPPPPPEPEPAEPTESRAEETAPETPSPETSDGRLPSENDIHTQEAREESPHQPGPSESGVSEPDSPEPGWPDSRAEEPPPAEASAEEETTGDQEQPSGEPEQEEERLASAEAGEESRPSEPEEQRRSTAKTEEESQPAESSPEAYAEAATLAEIERVRRYKDQVGLPPSLHERTAGGVEWHRSRGRGGRGPRHRDRRPRGGRRPRRERGRPGPRRLHARPSRGQPAIAELLRAGQEIIVQIAKEQMGKKGARITSHVSLPGRFLVYMPTIEHVGISRKIGTSDERSRLRRLLLDLKGTITGGFVVRTAASGCSEEDLRQDIDYLVKLWHDIRVRADERPPASLLHRDLGLVERILRDQLTPDTENVWLDNEEEYAKVVEFVGHFQPALASRIKLYTKDAPIFEEMGVQREIDRALQPKVWLKSGGYIVINHTEALVAIDVNTGKYVGKGSTRLEDTIVKTNIDAIQEIVRQIRLRDLGGIIIIDFIDMEDRRNRHRVMRALEDALRTDRSPSKVLSFNEFGLVAITRKRSRQSLERLLCQPCPYCTGTGMVKSIPTLCYEIQGETKKMAAAIDAPELTIRANPEIVKALKSREGNLVRELEEQTGKNIILQPDNALHVDQYSIY